MNNNSKPQYMDKQIMDLSDSQSPITAHISSAGGNNDFIDLMNRPAEKKDDIVPSYDFVPIRPSLGSSSPTAGRSSNLGSGNDDAPMRTWNSVDSKIGASPVRNYSSPVADEPANFSLGRNHNSSDVSLDVSLVSEIDRTMKKHMDNVMHAVDKMSARLTQLETRTRNIENSVDDLKVIIENNHGRSDGKMRSLENVLTEVQTGVQFIKDKEEIIEAELKIAKLQIPKTEQVENKNSSNPVPSHTGIPTHQQFPNPSLTQPPPPTLPPLNAPAPTPQHNAYSSGIRPPSGASPPLQSQQYYGPNPNVYEPPSSKIGPGPGYSGSFGPPPSGHGEPYPYSGSPVKSQQISSHGMGASGYPQLPTARILPQALPTASAVGGGPGPGTGSGSNRVPIDDVVDRVTNMGFSREQVRATVRKLTENGQAVDLNVVLDKLMNEGDGQAPREEEEEEEEEEGAGTKTSAKYQFIR
ncbi:Protein of unknown function (DUF1421 [Striga hermonthica]|uniref:UBA domain-containing protein n=1 Tax=Striga hermonthica TaxID=68872 RepID=A0A9N7RFN9_STRHE|nr:Protein of unknown function (DUF1421 [Striga hermonthica]